MQDSFPYAELQTVSNFSFLHGASHPEELIHTAAALGYHSLAICDHQTLSGIVRAYRVASEMEASGMKVNFITGSRLTICPPGAAPDSPALPLLAYPISRKGYGNLCRLISHIRQQPEDPPQALPYEFFASLNKEIAFTIVPPSFIPTETSTYRHYFIKHIGAIIEGISERRLLSLAISKEYGEEEKERLEFIDCLASRFNLQLLASNNVLYHSPERRLLQDTLHCIRSKQTIEQAGFELQQNTERYLKPRAEIYRLFRQMPHAIVRGLEIAEICNNFSLAQLKYEYPNEVSPLNESATDYLGRLVFEGAAERYPAGVPEKIKNTLTDELKLIRELEYEKYFLTCYDIVKYARSREILCQGRGAAASSAVCYCLGITSVDPAQIDLLFARFISKERDEPPDIDIDFEHERREEVIQYIYNRYGRERSGLVCEVVSYRHRSAVRDVGKALGLSVDIVTKIAKSIHRWNDCALTEHDLQEIGLNPGDIAIRNTILLSQELQSFPRHLSQHVGGFIISDQPLCELVPILNARMESRTIIEWDKDDIELLGMLKIDILALGMLTCIRKALELVNARNGAALPRTEMHTIPHEDPVVYDMICDADTVGVFQIESRAQMSMLPRLRPRTFYDLVIEVAIVRPGPIQGNMIHPYLKRRMGEEQIHYPDQRVRDILYKTLGVPLFQEQAMKLAITLAGFSPGEAERLRRAIAAWKHNKEVITTFTERVIAGMTSNGYERQFAETCMQQIRGFSEYGFPESHAASFALLVYVSSWLKRYYPAEFTAALLNSQPMGFYAPSQIIRDAEKPFHAKRPAITVLPVDVNRSHWDCTIEPVDDVPAVRLGLRMVRGMREAEAEKIVAITGGNSSFASIQELWNRCRAQSPEIRRSTFHLLARADAFHSFNGIDRHQALWQVRGLIDQPLLQKTLPGTVTHTPGLPTLNRQESMFRDYEQTGFSLRAHPLEFLREYLNTRNVMTSKQLRDMPISRAKRRVTVAGIGIVRQRPGTAKGMVFLTIEDETGVINIMIRPQVYERFRDIVISSSTLIITGIFEKVSAVLYVQAEGIASLDAHLKDAAPGIFPNNSYSY